MTEVGVADDGTDLLLEIGRNTGDGYPVVARVGAQTATTHMPVTSVALDGQLVDISGAVQASSDRAPATEEEQRVRELGQRLFEALISGEVRELYVTGRERAREQGGPIRLVLRIYPVELARLPWEFLFDPERQDYLGLTLSLVHYPEVLAPRQPLPTTTPLRILGMVLRPGDEDALDIDEERQRLGAALAGWENEGLVELGWVAGPTTEDLKEALTQGPWHALHVVDRGEYDPVGAQRGTVWATQPSRPHLIGSDDVSRLLAEHDTLRLVVLSSSGSEAGRVPAGSSNPAGSINTARTLLRRGIPSVVAMQFGITDPAAVRFAQTLYYSVATQLPVDTAVLRARQGLRLAKKDTLEWGSPVLYLRAPGGRIVTPATTAVGSQASQPEPQTRYDEALDAFWSQRWEQAIELLRKVFDHHPDHPDAATKLAQACHEQLLATRYAQALAAVDAADWVRAIAGFAMVADADPTNLDVRARLEDAQRQRDAAALALDLEEPAEPAVESPPLVRHPRAEQIMHARREINAVAFSPDGRWLATASRKNVAQIWDATTGRELLSVGSKAWRRSMTGVAFSPDGRLLATASDDGTARIWDAGNGDELLKVTHDGPVWGVAFNPDGSWLATAGDDCTARVWIVPSGDELSKITHDNWVRGVAFSPDGSVLATAGVDRTARIWNPVTGQELARATHDSLVSAVAFSPDGRWLATASPDCTARIWDATSGQEVARITYNSLVSGVAFSPDGRWLATASPDCTARVWDLTNGAESATVVHADQVWGVTFSPDGRCLATASADQTARIWTLEPDDEPVPLHSGDEENEG